MQSPYSIHSNNPPAAASYQPNPYQQPAYQPAYQQPAPPQGYQNPVAQPGQYYGSPAPPAPAPMYAQPTYAQVPPPTVVYYTQPTAYVPPRYSYGGFGMPWILFILGWFSGIAWIIGSFYVCLANNPSDRRGGVANLIMTIIMVITFAFVFPFVLVVSAANDYSDS